MSGLRAFTYAAIPDNEDLKAQTVMGIWMLYSVLKKDLPTFLGPSNNI